MLVLSRSQEQSIIIGDNIEITVLRIQKNKVRIGINAPKDIRVLRMELQNLNHPRALEDKSDPAKSENST